MFQSNSQINKAFLAVLNSLEKMPMNWKLRDYRSQNMFDGSVNMRKTSRCSCPDGSDKVNIFPHLYPIFPSEGYSYLGEYSVLPFFYLMNLNDSRAFPIVELIEIPLIHQNLYLKNVEKEKIDSMLSGLGSSFNVSQIKITKENISDELGKIRKKVLEKTFDITNKSATIFFSAFTNLPQSIISADESGYLQALLVNHENISWSTHSKKIIPFKYKSDVLTFTLNCWALDKHEV